MKPVSYCQYYKYLGVNRNEYLDFKFTVEKHTDSAGRALGAIINKMIKNCGFPYKVYKMLYNACVTSIADYSGPITGFDNYDSALKLHLRAIRAFLGVPKNVCSVGLISEVDLLMPQYRTKIQMVRLYNRFLCMGNDKLTKQIYLWDRVLNDNKIVNTWSTEVKSIFEQCNLLGTYASNSAFSLKSTLSTITSLLELKQIEYLKEECEAKPKMRTFISFKDFQGPPSYITKPLNFHHRRMFARTRLGCLPLRIETGRYSVPRLPEDQRTCLVCQQSDQLVNVGVDGDRGPVESEGHFLFICVAYEVERGVWYGKMNLPENFVDLSIEHKLKIVLNDPANVKPTAIFITDAFNLRSTLLR